MARQEDINTYYNDFDATQVKPSDLAYEIDDASGRKGECDALKNGRGTKNLADGENCNALQNDLIPALVQEYEAIKDGDIVISANERSKCKGSNLPTIASILSRVLRFSEAVACILCTYDPVLINILKSGHYPQILMGQTGSVYPIWRDPEESPNENSKRPITSGGVWEAIKQAIMQVFHEATDDRAWVQHGGKLKYSFYSENVAGLANVCKDYAGKPLTGTCPAEGDTAMVKTGANGTNQEYVYENGNWVALDVCGEPSDYAVIQIEKGVYADRELYWLKVGNQKTWNQMDVSDVELKKRLTVLEEIYGRAVLSAVNGESYVLAVRDTYAQANAVPATANKTTVVLVIGAP